MSISAVSSASSYLTSLYSGSGTSAGSASTASTDTTEDTTSTTSGTSSTSSSSSSSSNTDQVANPNGTLDKNDFLKMMITKLENQDPLSVDDSDFTTSMAQYSQLEASQNSNDLLTTMNSKIDDMNSNFVSQMALTNTGQAVSLVGKSVHVETKDTSGNVTADVTGTVTEVKFVSGVAMLVINGTQYSLSDVQEVSAAS